jgi:peptide/nickel transport system permease protein
MGRNPSDLILFVGKRLLQLVPVVLGVVFVTFFFSHVIPNVCAIWFPRAKSAELAQCTIRYGLNQPLTVQLGGYLSQLLTGNWGISPQGQAVYPAIVSALPDTLELIFAALLLMVFIGIPLGVIAANSSGRWADHVVRIFYLSGWATPTYLAAVVLAIGVGPVLGLPTHSDFSTTPTFPQPTHFSVIDAALTGHPSLVVDALAHLALPAIALAFINMGIATRMTRSSMLEVLPLDFVKTARMKGLAEFWVLYKHALRNSLITTTTVLGVTAGGLLSGTVVIERIFEWPGIGYYAYNALTGYNYPGTFAVVIVFAVAVVVANLVADILYGVLDPRVEWR